MKHPIIALHGFLGLPSDWNVLSLENVIAFDINSFDWGHLSDWAEKFNNQFRNLIPNPILMGYSLGGRLALHALIQDTSIWKAGIVISTHPGLNSSEERIKRLQSDQIWADRFLKEDWNHLMQAWNHQPVFKGSCPMMRKEWNYDRQQLASLLMKTSLGFQQNLRKEIRQLSIPLLWLIGEHDSRYLSLASSVNLDHPKSEKVVVPKTSHRLPWDDPESVKKIVSNWIMKI